MFLSTVELKKPLNLLIQGLRSRDFRLLFLSRLRQPDETGDDRIGRPSLLGLSCTDEHDTDPTS